MPDIAVDWITDEPGFLGLREPWNRLAVGAQGASVFLRHEWFDAAWQWRKNDRCALRIATVSRVGELVGVCPLVVHETVQSGLPVRKLEFLSVPDTQFCDIVCSAADAVVVGDAVAAALRTRAGEWSMLDLRHLRNAGAAAGLAGKVDLRARKEDEWTPWDANAYIELAETWDTYYSRRTRSLKKANKLAANRLSKAGELEIEWLRGGGHDPELAGALLEEFVGVSARSWKARSGLTLDNAEPGAFIRRLTRHALEQGWLSMWGLRIDRKLVAMEYQLIYGGDVFALRADFDQSLETISPGSYLNLQLLQRLFASGLRRYWLGPGPNPYKARWTDQSETLYRIAAYSPTARGRLHRLNERLVRPVAKRMLAALRGAKAEASESADIDG
ncbi:MAG: GNAT family N-acetyltransferase [Burkholderiales bacterium]|nr:GNAT family N-acetyltransferase [Burkholderiales bacterium]